jgi:adenylylsulfate kinase-like enzyme
MAGPWNGEPSSDIPARWRTRAAYPSAVSHAGESTSRGVVIVVTGPIASGKSTVAGALARELELLGVGAAVIDLDLVHDQLTTKASAPDDSTWTLARRETATLANAFQEAGVAVVIAEGSFNMPTDRATLVQHLRPSTDVVFVTLQVSFAEALRRAQGDPTRGRSQDPQLLGWHFAARHDVLAAVPGTDIVIDTERTTIQVAATTIARLVVPPSG